MVLFLKVHRLETVFFRSIPDTNYLKWVLFFSKNWSLTPPVNYPRESMQVGGRVSKKHIAVKKEGGR